MTVTLQVLYPRTEGTTFDTGYYVDTHLPLVGEHMGAHIASTLVTCAEEGDYFAIATLVFEDAAAREAGLAQAEPVLANIPKFTNTTPIMQMGTQVG